MLLTLSRGSVLIVLFATQLTWPAKSEAKESRAGSPQPRGANLMEEEGEEVFLKNNQNKKQKHRLLWYRVNVNEGLLFRRRLVSTQLLLTINICKQRTLTSMKIPNTYENKNKTKT